MLVMVDRSGRVPWLSHRRDPTILRSCVSILWRSESGISLCGIESTGWPERYGVVAGEMAGCCIFANSKSCSEKACWGRWTFTLFCSVRHWNLIPRKWDTVPIKSTWVSSEKRCSNAFSTL